MYQYFEFDNVEEANGFTKTVNKLINDFGCTTLGHLKEYYGVPQGSIKDIEYCMYVEKPARCERNLKAHLLKYKKTIRRNNMGAMVRYVICNIAFSRYDSDGVDQYPDYDEKGNKVVKRSYIQDDNAVALLAAAILERTAIDMRNDRCQGCWETEWFKELVHNDDIDPTKLRDKINVNRHVYGSWKVPDDDDTSDKSNMRNRSVLNKSPKNNMMDYEYPMQHNHRSDSLFT